MKVSLSNTATNPNVRAAAYGLWEANLLAEYNVSFAVSPGSVLSRMGELTLFSEIKRRIYTSTDDTAVVMTSAEV